MVRARSLIGRDKNKKGGDGMVLRLPVRGMPSYRVIYEFSDLKGKVVGSGFKLYLRDVLKRVPEYHKKIELDFHVEGKTEDGIPISINTLGRWLFGVPGYAGNARFIAYPDEVPYVEVWCGGCGEEVVAVLDKLFSYVGGRRVEK
jgi:hypothetical protein